MAETAAGAAASARKPLFSEGYKQTVLWLLVLAYTFNFIKLFNRGCTYTLKGSKIFNCFINNICRHFWYFTKYSISLRRYVII